MPRYRLTVEYDGSGYNGFQAQAGQPTVQGALEAAILAFSGEAVRIVASGLPGREPLAVRLGHTTFALRRHEAAFIRVTPGAEHHG